MFSFEWSCTPPDKTDARFEGPVDFSAFAGKVDSPVARRAFEQIHLCVKCTYPE